MSKGLFTDLNIDKSFRNEVNNLNEERFYQWIMSVYLPYDFSKYKDVMEEVILNFPSNLDTLLNKIENLLKEESKYEKYFLSSLKHLILSKDNRHKIFNAMDDLTKYVYKHTKSLDQMLTERLRQFKIITELKEVKL